MDLTFELVYIEALAKLVVDRAPEISVAVLAVHLAFLDNLLQAVAVRIQPSEVVPALR